MAAAMAHRLPKRLSGVDSETQRASGQYPWRCRYAKNDVGKRGKQVQFLPQSFGSLLPERS